MNTEDIFTEHYIFIDHTFSFFARGPVLPAPCSRTGGGRRVYQGSFGVTYNVNVNLKSRELNFGFRKLVFNMI